MNTIEKIESSLWEAADQLRANSKLTSSEYRWTRCLQTRQKPSLLLLSRVRGRLTAAQGDMGVQRSRSHAVQRESSGASRQHGLFIEGMRSEPTQLEKNYTLSAFAPWIYLGASWKIRGDFSIPVLKARTLYEEIRKDSAVGRKKGVVHK
jgi:hypothetical protein